MPERYIRRITWALLPIILWTFAGGPAYAALAATEQAREAQRDAARKALPRDFDDVVAELGAALKAVEADDGGALEKTKSLRAEIEERDVALRKEFADVEAMIRDKGLPEEILQRHRDFVTEYDKRLSSVKAGLDNVERGAVAPEGFFERAWFKTKILFTGDPVRQEAAGELEAQLESYRPRKVQKSFKPEDLPFRRMTPENTPKPKETAEEWQKALAEPSQNTASLQKAIGAVADVLISPAQAQATDLPGPEDLAETIEVQFTPEIVALAAQLNNNPVEIYNWVRNNIQFIPIWGSIQGSQGCYETRVCSAFDVSSLTIALLRVSGVAARYRIGTIEVAPSVFNNWAGGFLSTSLAAQHVASGGTAIRSRVNTQGDIEALVFEHVWVSAFLDYEPSLGSKPGIGDTWIGLDSTFQLFSSEIVEDLSLVTSNLVPEINAAIDQVIQDPETAAVTSIDIDVLETAISNNATSILDRWNGVPASAFSLADLFPNRVVVPATFTTSIPGGPYRVLHTAPQMPAIPENLRHRIRIQLDNDEGRVFSYESSLPEINAKTITLMYSGTSEREMAIAAGLWDSAFNTGDLSKIPRSFPASLMNVTPYLFIGGEAVMNGQSAKMGSEARLTVAILSPTVTTAIIESPVIAGESIGVGITPGKISQQQIDRVRNRLLSMLESYDRGDLRIKASRLVEDQLSPLVWGWFSAADSAAEMLAVTAGIKSTRFPSAGFYSFKLKIDRIFGLPFRASPVGTVLDIARDLVINTETGSTSTSAVDFTFVQGVTNSAYEEAIPEILTPTNIDFEASGSAVGLLGRAADNGIPISVLNSTNGPNLLDVVEYSAEEKRRISDGISSGRVVIVANRLPTQTAPFSRIEVDPSTGGGRYLVDANYGGYLRVCSQCQGLEGEAQIQCLTGGDDLFDVGCIGGLIAFATMAVVAAAAGGAYLLEGLLVSYPGLAVQGSLIVAQAQSLAAGLELSSPLLFTGVRAAQGALFLAQTYSCANALGDFLSTGPELESMDGTDWAFAKLGQALVGVLGANACRKAITTFLKSP